MAVLLRSCGGGGQRERKNLSWQFTIDAQPHFVNDKCVWKSLFGLRRAAFDWNPDLQQEDISLRLFGFKNFVRLVFLESGTAAGLLSSAPPSSARTAPDYTACHHKQDCTGLVGTKQRGGGGKGEKK